MPRRNGIRPQSLRNIDFNDRDLLAIVNDLGDNDGWASTEDIAHRVFGTGGSIERQTHAKRCVAVRFGWLRYYGVVENSGRQQPVSWRLTEAGIGFLFGADQKRTEAAIDRMPDADLLHAAMAVGERYADADTTGQILMRRAFQFYTQKG